MRISGLEATEPYLIECPETLCNDLREHEPFLCATQATDIVVKQV
jgi:hypothetical protein